VLCAFMCVRENGSLWKDVRVRFCDRVCLIAKECVVKGEREKDLG